MMSNILQQRQFRLLPPIRQQHPTGAGYAQLIESPEAVDDRKLQAYYQEQARQRQQAPDITGMGIKDVLSLVDSAASDAKFQKFYEDYDPSKSKLQLTPQEEALVQKYSRMLGTSWANNTDPGISQSQILAAVEFYGLTNKGGKGGSEATHDPVVEQQVGEFEARMAGQWQLHNRQELDYRLDRVAELYALLPDSQKAQADKNPTKAADKIWQDFVSGKFDRGLESRGLPTSRDYRGRFRV